MNWFTKTYCGTFPLERKVELLEEHGGCDHVENDPSLMFCVSYENDAWGREGYCMCQSCTENAEEAEGQEMVTCHDCGQEFQKKDTIEWRWYDFYAPQGDEPLTICEGCRHKETHLERRRRDRADLEEELDQYERDWQDDEN